MPPIMEHPGKQGVMIIHKKVNLLVTDYEVMEEYGKIFCSIVSDSHRTHNDTCSHEEYRSPGLYAIRFMEMVLLFWFPSLKSHNFSKVEEEERPILNRLGLHA